MSEPLVTLEDVTLGYQRHPAVHHLTGQLAAGRILAVTGPNGSGKSTLLKALAGRLKPLGGTLRIAPGIRQALLPQLVEFEQGFPIRVDDFVALGIEQPLWTLPATRVLRARAAEALARIGLTGLEDRPIATLSGGQMQRVRLARLMVSEARLVLLDEPLAALDDASAAIVVALMREWRAQGRAVVAVLHEQELIRAIADEVLLLARDVVAWGAPATVLKPDVLAKAASMRQDWDQAAPVCAPQGVAAA